MSKEHYFRIISNTWQDTELLPDHVTIKDKKFLLLGDEKVQLIPAHADFYIRFDDLHYQCEVRDLVKKFKKEINTWIDLGKFQLFCHRQGHPFEEQGKVYFVQNNGKERKISLGRKRK